jgi:copper homeostasis protein
LPARRSIPLPDEPSEVERPLIEICVEGIDGFLAAQEAGADRVELCASLLEGGITPSFGVVAEAQRQARIPIHVIVRPRGGDFLYSDTELETMRADIVRLREMNVAGVVIGILTADGEIDEARMSALVAAARPMAVTCHRAFDMTRDPEAAIKALVRCGVDSVLTSGQRDTAVEGLPTLQRAKAAARGRIKIMVCGALDETNIARVLRESGADELHFAAPHTVPSAMTYRNPHVGMGGTAIEREYQLTLTDPVAVRATIAAARQA